MVVPLVLVAGGLVSMGVGCTRMVYVPVERVTVDSVRDSRMRIDTVVSRDSVVTAQRGDTVVREVYRWRERSRVRVDTVRSVRVDTVTKVITAPRSVEQIQKPKADRSIWSRLLDACVWAARLVFICFACLAARKLLQRLRSRS